MRDRFGYMDMTDFYDELGEGPTCKIYSSIEQLKKDSPCVKQCGIVKVKVILEEAIQEPNYELESK